MSNLEDFFGAQPGAKNPMEEFFAAQPAGGTQRAPDYGIWSFAYSASDAAQASIFGAAFDKDTEKSLQEYERLKVKRDAANQKLGRDIGGDIEYPFWVDVVQGLSVFNFAETAFVDAALTGKTLPEAFHAAAREFTGSMESRAISGGGMNFDMLMEKHGVGPAGHISDVLPWLFNETGEGWKPKRGGLADLSGRGALGWYLDFRLDPLSYLHAGKGILAGSVTRGGRIVSELHLSKAGLKTFDLLEAEGRPRVLRLAERLAASKNVDDLTPSTLKHARDVDILQDELSRQLAVNRIWKRAKLDPSLLDDQVALRLGPAKVVTLPTGPMSTARKNLLAALEGTSVGARILNAGIRPVNQMVDHLFRSTLRDAGQIPGYLSLKDQYRAMKNGAINGAEEDLKEITKGWDQLQEVKDFQFKWEYRDKPLNVYEYLQLHLDNPQGYPASRLPAAVQDAVLPTKTGYQSMWDVETALFPETMKAWRPDYAGRYYKNTARELADLTDDIKAPWMPQTRGGGLGAHYEERTFSTIDEAMKYARRLKESGRIKWDLNPELDFRKAFLRRAHAHATAVSTEHLWRRVGRLYGVSDAVVDERAADMVLPELTQMMDGLGKEVTTDLLHASRARVFLRKAILSNQTGPFTPDELSKLGEMKRRVGRVLSMPPREGALAADRLVSQYDKALVMLGRMRGATTLGEIEEILRTHEKLMMSVNPKFRHEVLDLFQVGRKRITGSWSEPWGPVVLESREVARRAATGKIEKHVTWLPRSMADDLNRLREAGVSLTPGLEKALRVFDWSTDAWKTGHTLWPAFFFRNKYTNSLQAFVSAGIAALHPGRMYHAIGVMRGWEGTMRVGNRRYTYDQLQRMALKYGVYGPSDAIFERGGDVAWRRRALIDAKPIRVVRSIFGSTMENHDKLTLWLTHMDQGLSPAAAVRKVNKALFDYEELSPFRRDILRRFIPFSVWPTKNLAYQLESLVTHPGRILALQKLGDRGPDDTALQEYLDGEFKVRLERAGGKAYLIGIDMPFQNALDMIWSEDFESTSREWLAGLSPFFRTLPESATGSKFFTGKSIAGRQVLAGLNSWLARAPVVRDWLEWNTQVDPETGEVEYTVNRTKFYFWLQGWAWGRLIGEADQFEKIRKDKGLAAALLDFHTGLRWDTVEASEEVKRLAKKRARALHRALVRAGEEREYTTQYTPKEKK